LPVGLAEILSWQTFALATAQTGPLPAVPHNKDKKCGVVTPFLLIFIIILFLLESTDPQLACHLKAVVTSSQHVEFDICLVTRLIVKIEVSNNTPANEQNPRQC